MPRFIKPLKFVEGGKTVEVRKTTDIKRFFASEHVTQLTVYLQDGSLAQFFYGLAKDELSDLIKNRMAEGAQPIAILNELAEKLGVEPLECDVSATAVVVGISEPLSAIFSRQGGANLPSGEWIGNENETFVFSEPFSVEGSGTTKTVLRVKNIVLRGDGSGEISLRKLAFVAPEGEQGVLELSGIKASIEEVLFSGLTLRLTDDASLSIRKSSFENTPVAIDAQKGCALETSELRFYKVDNPLIHSDLNIPYELAREITISGKSIVLRGTKKVKIEVRESINPKNLNLTIENLHLVFSKDASFNAEDSTVIIKDSHIEGGSGILLKKSRFSCENSDISNSVGIGVYAKSSELILKDTKVWGHYYNGIFVHENTQLQLESCEVFKNGNSDESYPQLVLGNSKATVIGSNIHEGVKNEGVYAASSELILKDTKVWGHYYVGIFVHENTQLRLESCEVFKNGNSDESYPQLGIVNSKATVIGSNIHEGVKNSGVYAASSELILKDTKVWGHYYVGIDVKENTQLQLESCEVFKNGNSDGSYSQLWIGNSKAVISRTTVHSGVKVGGVYI